MLQVRRNLPKSNRKPDSSHSASGRHSPEDARCYAWQRLACWSHSASGCLQCLEVGAGIQGSNGGTIRAMVCHQHLDAPAYQHDDPWPRGSGSGRDNSGSRHAVACFEACTTSAAKPRYLPIEAVRRARQAQSDQRAQARKEKRARQKQKHCGGGGSARACTRPPRLGAPRLNPEEKRQAVGSARRVALYPILWWAILCLCPIATEATVDVQHGLTP